MTKICKGLDDGSPSSTAVFGFKRILVIRGGAIGDFILTLPVFQRLRDHYPSATIDVLGYPSVASLAVVEGIVSEVSRIESTEFTSLFACVEKVPGSIANYFSQYDLIVSFLHDPKGHFQNRIRSVFAGRFLVGKPRPDENCGYHATQQFLEVLTPLALPVPSEAVEPKLLRNHPNYSDASKKDSAPLIALHPGSGSRLKNWPIPNWISLLELLLERLKARVVVIGGEADDAQLNCIKHQFRENAKIEWRVHQPLTELATQLKSCHCFVGHDSGPTHLAAALGIRTLVLWGNTNLNIWKPVGDHVAILHQNRNSKLLTPEAVLGQLTLKTAVERGEDF